MSILTMNAGYSQEAGDLSVSVDWSNLTFKSAVKDLESRYDLQFIYKEDQVISGTFSHTSQNIALSELLANHLLKDTKLGHFSYGENYVFIADQKAINQNYSLDYFVALEKSQTQPDPSDDLENYSSGSENTVNAAGTGTITGFLSDDGDGEFIIGATIYQEALDVGASTDVNGKFTIKLPIGSHKLKIQSVGYSTKEVIVEVYNDSNIDFTLAKEPVSLKEIVIEAQAAKENVNSINMGVETLNPLVLKKQPAFLGEVDIVKSLLMLPGVSTVGEGSGGFNVRGGTVDQNLILQDEAFLFNASHVLGFFSLFNPDLVSGVTLYKGSVPAQYGGRLSSVLSVEFKDGNFQKVKGNGGIGVIASRIAIDGPIKKGRSSFIVGLRSSYSDWILGAVNIPEVKNSSAFFYDANAKVTQLIGEKGKLSLSAYLSKDQFSFDNQFSFDYDTKFVNLEYKQIVNDKISSSFNAIYNIYDSGLSDPEGIDAFDLDSQSKYFKFKEQLTFTPNNQITVDAGAEFIKYEIDPGIITPLGNQSSIIAEDFIPENANELSGFVNAEIAIGIKFGISVGARYTTFSNVGERTIKLYQDPTFPTLDGVIGEQQFSKGEEIVNYNGIEPRIGLKYQLTPTSSIKLSYNKTRQYINQVSNTASVTPVDVWQLSNSYIKPQASDNYSVGIFKNFLEDTWETSVEVYYRDIENLIEYRDFAQLIGNNFLETELLTGEGRNYGVEVSAKKNIGRMKGFISYTYSKTERRVENEVIERNINFGKWYPSNFNKPHDLSMTATYEVSKRASFSANFTYSSGRPTTGPAGKFNVLRTFNIPDYSDRNQLTIPNYHRLDLAYTIEPNHKKAKKWSNSWTFSIYNIYGRKNAYSVFFTQAPFQNPTATKLSILGSAFPAITYNFKF